jgi:NAD-dependent SIR2 family protein deacetylase
MRCPNCGRTIPEPQYSRNDPMMILSVCPQCGRVDTQPDLGDGPREGE